MGKVTGAGMGGFVLVVSDRGCPKPDKYSGALAAQIDHEGLTIEHL